MTLTTPYSATFIVGDGETKTFSYLFEEVSPNFISVMVYNSLTGLISTPTYIIDTDQKQVIFGEDTPAPTADETVCIYRNTPNVQDVAFRTLHGYDAQTLENILSKIVAMIQEIKSNYFSTQVLQGDPWQLDLLSSEDDGATVNIDYTAKKLVKGLYFKITSGNLQVSADGVTYLTLPKSDDVAEFRQYEQTLPDLTVIRKLQYRVGNQWYDAEANAQYTADEAYALAEAVQTTVNAHINNTTNPHQTSLANLTDTDLTGLVANQFLRFNGIKWAPVYSSATVYWGEILGNLDDQADLKIALDGKVEKAGDTMTGALNIADIASSNTPLLTLTHSNTATYKWNIAPRYNSTTLSVYPGSTETNGFRFATTGFVPASDNARYLGSASLKWKGVYTGALNNGADLIVPNKSGTIATMADVELAAQSGTQLYETGVWYAKTKDSTVPPASAEVEGRNYADFSNNKAIIIYEYTNGAWKDVEHITPPSTHNAYLWITSKIWDIPEQQGQQGGVVLWDFVHETFTPYPRIVDVDLTNYLQNTATGTNSLTILGDATSANTALNIGPYSTAEGTNSLAIGPGTGDSHRARATHANAIALGYDALALAIDAIQLGTGQGTTQGLFKVWNYTMLDKTTGKIPIARLGDDTSTTQGNVLTLDSNGAAVWQAPSGGGSAGQSIDAEIYGSVTVSGNDISNFSTGDYVRIPGVFQFKDASSFEIVGAFTTNANSGSQIILCPTNGWLVYMMSGIRIMNSLTDGQQLLHVTIWPDKTTTLTSQSFRGTTNLAANTKYYIKLTYDGTDYKLYLSTDGVNYALEASDTATYLPETNANGYYLGPRPDSTGTMIAILHMDTWSIKKDAVTVWTGVDAPGLHQRAESSHEVIAFQSPTAGNNYTWYRKYADGWVEQGGYKYQGSSVQGNNTINLPVTMADTNYTVLVTQQFTAAGQGYVPNEIYPSRTTASFVLGVASAVYGYNWEVKGMAQ